MQGSYLLTTWTSRAPPWPYPGVPSRRNYTGLLWYRVSSTTCTTQSFMPGREISEIPHSPASLNLQKCNCPSFYPAVGGPCHSVVDLQGPPVPLSCPIPSYPCCYGSNGCMAAASQHPAHLRLCLALLGDYGPKAGVLGNNNGPTTHETSQYGFYYKNAAAPHSCRPPLPRASSSFPRVPEPLPTPSISSYCYIGYTHR